MAIDDRTRDRVARRADGDDRRTGLSVSIEGLLGDLRLATRGLVRSPGFTVTTVLSLGLGLALTAATLSLLNAFLVRSLPFPALDRLYHVDYASAPPEPRGLTALDWKTLDDVVEVADSSAPTRMFAGDDVDMRELAGLAVSAGALDAIGLEPLIGSSFRPEDFALSSERVALIGHSLWRTRYHSDPNVVGQVLRVRLGYELPDAVSFRIVGVLPPGFRYVRTYARDEIDVVAPLRGSLRAYLVRLRDGVPPDVAAGRITEAVKASATWFPPGWTGVKLESVHDRYVRDARPVLALLAVAVGFVLLIVCANAAVLTLLRANRRRKEFAVRLAIGARRRHILRMLLAEMTVVCGAALALALALTSLSLAALAPAIEQQLGRPIPGGGAALKVDPTVLVAMIAVSLAVVLLVSLVPLLALRNRRLGDALRGDARAGVEHPVTRWTRSMLVGAEVAVSLALLGGCGLMIQSVVNLVRTDLGVETENVVRTRFVFPSLGFPETALQFQERLLERLSTISNSGMALTGFPLLVRPNAVELETEAGGTRVSVGVLGVSTGFFEAMRVPILEGRGVADADRMTAAPVAVVSQALKRRLWPGRTALGQRVRTIAQAEPGAQPNPWRIVVGVAGDVRQSARDQDLNDLYVPLAQAPSRFVSLYVRSDQSASFWLDTLRAAVREIGANVQMDPFSSVRATAEAQLAGERFLAWLLSGFSAFAALLAMLGVYGATAYAVQQRRSEVAIRIALGASRRTVLGLFLKDGAVVLFVGMASGLAGAVSIGKLLGQQLYGVGPLDASTIGAVCAVTTLCAMAATWWPARRAATTNPAVVLKEY